MGVNPTRVEAMLTALEPLGYDAGGSGSVEEIAARVLGQVKKVESVLTEYDDVEVVDLKGALEKKIRDCNMLDELAPLQKQIQSAKKAVTLFIENKENDDWVDVSYYPLLEGLGELEQIAQGRVDRAVKSVCDAAKNEMGKYLSVLDRELNCESLAKSLQHKGETTQILNVPVVEQFTKDYIDRLPFPKSVTVDGKVFTFTEKNQQKQVRELVVKLGNSVVLQNAVTQTVLGDMTVIPTRVINTKDGFAPFQNVLCIPDSETVKIVVDTKRMSVNVTCSSVIKGTLGELSVEIAKPKMEMSFRIDGEQVVDYKMRVSGLKS